MRLANVRELGIKELFSLARDSRLLILIVYSFTVAIYAGATAIPETLHKAPIAIHDEDRSPLSSRIVSAFYPPHFMPPAMVPQSGMDAGMDAGQFTFALDIPPDFQRDVLAGRSPTIQLNVDATRMSQAFVGSGYIQAMIGEEVNDVLLRSRTGPAPMVDLALRARFNPTLTQKWFGAVMQVINNITMLSLVLTGAALIRERERGTIEHLLVMPVTPTEIMLSKVWPMGLVVLAACVFSLQVMVRGLLAMPIEGSLALFVAGAAVHLFATTSLGIFMATVARSMPQFGLLMILVLLPLQMLSGGSTPRESMPGFMQTVMWVAPTTHFVMLAQAILYRGAGLEVVWPQFVSLAGIGTVFFVTALRRLRSTIGQMG